MGIANPIVIATLTFKRLKRSRSLSGTITTHTARPAKMVKLVGRMIVENPARTPNISHSDVRAHAGNWGASSDAAASSIDTAKIVTNNVGTSLITSDEYVMNMGERASTSDPTTAAARPNSTRARRKS